MSWTIVNDVDALNAALKLARGCYQRALLQGVENLSGSTLRGRAKEYAGRYKQSAETLLFRMTSAGIPWTEIRGDHNKRILVIGGAAVAVEALGASSAAVAEVAQIERELSEKGRATA